MDKFHSISSQPDDVSNVSFGSHLEYPDGSIPTVTKAHSGRMSPVRARTMKEYDQQIADLKKENFSLKLRIYFLEERVQQQFDGDSEALFKTNINLKVETESMKKELMDKQELLKKASHAMESLATQHQVEVQQIREQLERDSGHHMTELEDKLRISEKDCYRQKQSLDEANLRLQELERSNKELLDTIESQVAQDKQDEVEEKYKDLLSDRDLRIEDLEHHLEEMEVKVKDLEVEKVETLKNLQTRISALQNDMPAGSEEKVDAEIQTAELGYAREDSRDVADGANESNAQNKDAVEEHRRKVEELEVVLDQLTSELSEKDGTLENLEERLKDREKSIKDLQNKVTRAEEDGQQLKESAQKKDKAIQGLTLALHGKGTELDKLCEKIQELEGKLTAAKADLHRHHMSKYQDEEQVHQKLNDREGELAELEAQMRKKQLEQERLEKAVSRKEAELRELKEKVVQLEEAMQQSEQTLQELSDKLQDEKQISKRRVEDLENQYQGAVEDSQRQLQSKDKLVQQLTKSLREKDQQLQQYMDMVQEASNKPYTENKDLIISNLRERLKEREKALENAMEEKFKLAEEKDGETRQNKMAIREKDRDLERANQALLTAEETIDTLEREMKEKDQTMRQLTNALRARQKALEEAQDNYSRGIEEKEGLIGKLQKSLANKDQYMEELINQQSPGGSDVVIEQLRQQIAEKDRLLEEMMTERSKAAVANEKAANDLLGKLRDKDDEIKDVTEDYNRQVSQLNKELQRLQTDMNKKDYEIQLLTNRATWAEEQQQAMMDKMRAALGEKDKTIEALVESGREKDKMFRQIQESFAAQQPLSASRSAELLNLRDEVDRLQNEVLSKEGLVSRLRANMDRNPQHQVSKSAYEDVMSELEKQEKSRREAEREASEAKDKAAKLMQQLLSSKDKDSENERLKIEIVNLHEQLDRPGTPQRSQTTGGSETHVHINQMLQDQLREAQNLRDILKAEKAVYINLNQSEEKPQSSSSYHHEITVQLSQIEALRHQLQESIESNQQLREQLENQLKQSSASPKGENSASGHDSDNLQKDNEALRNQLEEAKRWNSSLQSRLNQQQMRGGGVGAAEPDLGTPDSKNTTYASILYDPEKPAEILFDSDQVLLKMAPGELRQEIAKLRMQLRDAQEFGAENEMRAIPGENEMDKAKRSEVPHLKKQLEFLEGKLGEADRLNESLQNQVDSALDERSASLTNSRRDELISKLRHELQLVQNDLKEKTMQNRSLVDQQGVFESQLAVAKSLSEKSLSPGKLDDQLLQMKHQLQHVQLRLQEKCVECESLRQRGDALGCSSELLTLKLELHSIQQENQLLREKLGLSSGDVDFGALPSVKDLQNEISQLESKLREEDRRSSLYKKQIEMDTSSSEFPAGFNPQLLVDMSKEVDRLKKELHRAKQEAKAYGKPPSGERKSQIPVFRRKSSTDSLDKGDDNVSSSSSEKDGTSEEEMRELQVQKRLLETKLLSTESTVRAQSRKIKSYRGMLEDAGLLSRTPSRSQSMTNLASDGEDRSPRSRSGSIENILIATSREGSPIPRGISGLNLELFERFGESDDTSMLQDQITTLKGQIERYLKIIKSLKERLKSMEPFRPVTPPSEASSYSTVNSQTPGINHFLAMNQDAFKQLQTEMDSLKKQLRTKDEHNASLMDLLSMVSPNTSVAQGTASAIQPVRAVSIENELRKLAMQQNRDSTLQRVIDGLKSKLTKGRGHCDDLLNRFTEIRHLVAEVLHQGDDGEVDMIDVTPSKVSEFKTRLGEAANVTAILSAVLEASEPVDSSDDEIPRQKMLALPSTGSRLEEVLDKCSKLEKNNKIISDERDDLKKKLAETNRDLIQQCKKLVDENEDVKRTLLLNDGNLAKQCKKLVAENEEVTQRLLETDNELQKKCASLDTKNTILEQEKEALERTVRQQNEGIAKSTERVKNLAKENAELQHKSSEQALELLKMAAQATKVIAQLDEARRTLVESEVLKKKLLDEKTEVEDRERDLKKRLSDAEEKLAEADALRKELGAVKTSHDQTKKNLQKRLDSYNRLKEHLKRNKDAADETRKELHKCAKQIQEKDDLITQLKQKLSKMQQKARHLPRPAGGQVIYSSDEEDIKSSRHRLKIKQREGSAEGIKSTIERLRLESESEPVHQRANKYDLDSFLSSSQASITDRLSIEGSDAAAQEGKKDLVMRSDDSFATERLRHRTVSSQNGNHLNNSMDYLSEGSTTSSQHRHVSPAHRPFLNYETRSNGERPVSEHEPDFPDLHLSLNDFESHFNISSHGVTAKFNQRGKSPAKPRSPTYNETERTERNYSAQKSNVIRVSDLSPRSRALFRSQSVESDCLQREVDSLKSKLNAADALNETLKDELQLYDTLSIRTAATLNTSRSQDPAGRENGLILSDHLEEIRLLRERLEESIKTYDQLRQQLEERLSQMDGQEAADFDALQKDYVNVRRQFDVLCQEVQEKDHFLQESKEILVSQDSIIREKQAANDTLEQKLREFETSRDSQGAEARSRVEENNKLKEEVTHLRDQVKRNEQLLRNQAAQLKEFSENAKTEKNSSERFENFGFEIGDLLNEIGRLRVQLERSINTNNALRKRLEQLAKGEGQNLSASLRSLLQPVVNDGQKPVRDQLDRVNLHESPQATKNLPTHDGSSFNTLGDKEYHYQPSNTPWSDVLTSDMRPENERFVNRQLFQESTTKDGASRAQSPSGCRNRPPSPQRAGRPTTPHRAGRPTSPQQSVTGRPPSPRRTVVGQENIAERLGTQTHNGGHVRSQSAMGRLSERDTMPPPDSLKNGGPKSYSTEHLNLFLDSCDRSQIRLNGDHYGTQLNPGIDSGIDLKGCRDNTDRPLTTADLGKENFHPSRLAAQSPRRNTFQDDKESTITSVSSLAELGASHMSNIPLTEVSRLRVCSDLRYLFAIGRLDDYELMKKEIGESTIIIRGMEARLQERMKIFKGVNPMQNLEYLTLKELSSAVENLNICLKEQHRVIRAFWTSQLPPKNHNGEYVDVRAMEENQLLRDKLNNLEGQYTAAMKMMKAAQKRLQATNRKKENMEEAIYRSLAQTEKMMRQARSNLQSRNPDDDDDDYE
ncbi:myomegalin-like isoform X3 [Lineus longissimus]|uniref:myomegalin-like isoform X3 n=1 Tax=Lineus longissimus TaxID=88925 RepID=UPI002B4DF8CB